MMQAEDASHAIGLCGCGCGKPTLISTVTKQPLPFLNGHIGRTRAVVRENRKRRVVSGEVQRWCIRCRRYRPLSGFNKSKYQIAGLRSYCQRCERKDVARWVRADPQRIVQIRKRAKVFNKAMRDELRDRSLRIKQYGCRACVEKELCCLEFHHVVKGDRVVANARRSVACFEREIVRCVVLCANCHKKAHAGKLKIEPEMMCRRDDGLSDGQSDESIT